MRPVNEILPESKQTSISSICISERQTVLSFQCSNHLEFRLKSGSEVRVSIELVVYLNLQNESKLGELCGTHTGCKPIEIKLKQK